MPYHVSKPEFARLVEEALEDLPPQIAAILEEVLVEIRSRPSRGALKRVGLKPGHLLLGLYHGRPLTQRSVMDSAHLPDVIYIYQDHIEQVCEDEQDLKDQVRTTVLHEIGHHFGLSEADLDNLGYG